MWGPSRVRSLNLKRSRVADKARYVERMTGIEPALSAWEMPRRRSSPFIQAAPPDHERPRMTDDRGTFGARTAALFEYRDLEHWDHARAALRRQEGRCEVFERFTDGARQCVVLGQEEAYAVEADAVGIEHMLLGLLDQGDELVAEALKGAGFPERAAQVSEAYPPPVRTVHIPWTPEAAKALRRSQNESAALGEAQVRPGHLLLALLPGDDSSSPPGDRAIKLLQEQGVDVAWLRNRLIDLLQSR
jgi:hypothetical protein